MGDFNFDFEAEIDAKDALRKASLRAEGINSSENNTATKGRRSQVCRHWIKNLCMKGDKCDYLHQLDPDKMPECMLWLRYGKCTDPDCTFRHVENSERPECQRYRLGFCRYGPMCRSRHDRLPRDVMPAVLPDWFIDSLLLNAYLVPRAEDVGLEVNIRSTGPGADRYRQEMALAPTTGEEKGTIPGLPPPIHGKCRYFMVRSVIMRNIQISAAKGIWATNKANAQRLRQAHRDVDHVIVIFCTSDTRNFTGYGKMTSDPDDMLFPGVWGEMSSRLSPSFRIHWLKQCAAELHKSDHIKNPQNEDLPVRRGKDGTELPSSVGERLCRYLWQQPYSDLLKGSDMEFEPPAIADAPRQVNGASAPPAAALALEDVKKDNYDDAGRARPAPEKIGSFASKVPIRGKALASGSSSLAAALASEDAHRPPHMPPPLGHHGAPPHWMPPPSFLPYGAPPLDPHHRGHPAPYFPPHGHHPHPGYPPPGGYYPPPAYGHPPHGYRPPPQGHPGHPVSPFEAGPQPPGFYAGVNRGPPPAHWQGASDAGGGRSRSRSKRRREKRKKSSR